MASAVALEKYIDGTAKAPKALEFTMAGPTGLTDAQKDELNLYEAEQLKWIMGKAVIKQAIAITIPNLW